MRRFIYLALAVSAALGFSGSAAGMTGPSEVVVVNDPLAVEVVNPSPPTARFQLVGFTSATYTGNMGGQIGVTQKCQLEFPSSRMCTVSEVQLTTDIPAVQAGFAWANQGGSESGIFWSHCYFWTDDRNAGSGLVIAATGLANSRACDDPHVIACCALVL